MYLVKKTQLNQKNQWFIRFLLTLAKLKQSKWPEKAAWELHSPDSTAGGAECRSIGQTAPREASWAWRTWRTLPADLGEGGIRHFHRKHFRRMHFRRRNIGRMEHWSNGTLFEWNIGRMEHWSNGTFVERNIRRTEHWSNGTLVERNIGRTYIRLTEHSSNLT